LIANAHASVCEDAAWFVVEGAYLPYHQRPLQCQSELALVWLANAGLSVVIVLSALRTIWAFQDLLSVVLL